MIALARRGVDRFRAGRHAGLHATQADCGRRVRWHSSVVLFIFALVGYFLTVVLPLFLKVVGSMAWPR